MKHIWTPENRQCTGSRILKLAQLSKTDPAQQLPGKLSSNCVPKCIHSDEELSLEQKSGREIKHSCWVYCYIHFDLNSAVGFEAREKTADSINDAISRDEDTISVRWMLWTTNGWHVNVRSRSSVTLVFDCVIILWFWKLFGLSLGRLLFVASGNYDMHRTQYRRTNHDTNGAKQIEDNRDPTASIKRYWARGNRPIFSWQVR